MKTSQFIWLIPLLPLATALINLIFRQPAAIKRIRQLSAAVISTTCLISLGAIFEMASKGGSGRFVISHIWTWIQNPWLQCNVIFHLDRISLVMVFLAALTALAAHSFVPRVPMPDQQKWKIYSLIHFAFGMTALFILSGSLWTGLFGSVGISVAVFLISEFNVTGESNAGFRSLPLPALLIADVLLLAAVLFLQTNYGFINNYQLHSFTAAFTHGTVPAQLTAVILCLWAAVTIKTAGLVFAGWTRHLSDCPYPLRVMTFCALIPVYLLIYIRNADLISAVHFGGTLLRISGLLTMALALFLMSRLPDLKSILQQLPVLVCGMLTLFFSLGKPAEEALVLFIAVTALTAVWLTSEAGERSPGFRDSGPQSGSSGRIESTRHRAHLHIRDLSWTVGCLTLFWMPPFGGFPAGLVFLHEYPADPIHIWLTAILGLMLVFCFGRVTTRLFSHRPAGGAASSSGWALVFAILSITGSAVFCSMLIRGSDMLIPAFPGAPVSALLKTGTGWKTAFIPALGIALAFAAGLKSGNLLKKRQSDRTIRESVPEYAALKYLWIDRLMSWIFVLPVKKIGEYLWIFDDWIVQFLFVWISTAGRKWSEFTVAFDRWFFDSILVHGPTALAAICNKLLRGIHSGSKWFTALAVVTGFAIMLLVLLYMAFLKGAG
ncbi:hypothetical protein JXA40_09965 [bacterium]|nr:hypothetical protein [candidate division CSSED10-310 bacterium]